MTKIDQDRLMNQQSEPDMRLGALSGASDPAQEGELLTAAQAAAFLDVKPATLYAYVSRGLLRSYPQGAGHVHRYSRGDLLRLKTRAEARSGHGPVAASALDFGEPVLESAVTKIEPSGARYRGYSAIELARSDTPFEAVAELLWSGRLPSEAPRWSARMTVPAGHLLRLLPAGTAPLSALSLLLPALAVRDFDRFAAPPEIEKERARQLLLQLCAGLTLAALAQKPQKSGRADPSHLAAALGQPTVAESILVALRLGATKDARSPRNAARAVNRALVLLADHELNPSTFAARVAASAGADLYACLAAALATVSGPRHGGACDRVDALIAEAERAGDAAQVVRDRLRRGESVPGFGHPLYPDGDPRTAPLLETAQELSSGKRARLAPYLTVITAMRDAGHPPPTVDLGLCALASVLGLPAGSASCLFAMGRGAGWVAHILEQRQNPIGLRPRARYNGPEQPDKREPGRIG